MPAADHKELGMTHLKLTALRRAVLAACLLPAAGGAAAGDVSPLPGLAGPVLAPGLTPGLACPAGRAFAVQDGLGTDRAGNHAIGRIQVSLDRNDLPADGQSAVKVRVAVFDRQDRPLCASVMLTIEAPGARVLLPGALTDEFGPGARDADAVVPGTQLVVQGGEAAFSLLAPGEPRDVRLRISAGDQVAEGTVSFLPELREMLAAGLIEGVIRVRGRSASFVTPTRNNDGFERDIRRWEREFNHGKANVGARAAFFVKGTVRGDVLLTAAYDSDKETRA